MFFGGYWNSTHMVPFFESELISEDHSVGLMRRFKHISIEEIHESPEWDAYAVYDTFENQSNYFNLKKVSQCIAHNRTGPNDCTINLLTKQTIKYSSEMIFLKENTDLIIKVPELKFDQESKTMNFGNLKVPIIYRGQDYFVRMAGNVFFSPDKGTYR